jgi:hypothetical protein
MSKIKFGWHMPSHPVDNSSGVTLVRQISPVLVAGATPFSHWERGWG